MIKEHLLANYETGRLYNSYLINTDSLESSLTEVKEFIASKIFLSMDIDHHPDFMLVEKPRANARDISVAQIRTLQRFLYQTSVLSGKKVAVVYGAEQMNMNAANSCLKILEDTPLGSYLFLLTKNAAGILPTIRSRCAKINYNYDNSIDHGIDQKYIKPLLKTSKIDERFLFLKEFDSKDRELWIEFSTTAEKILGRFCKKVVGYEIDLSLDEQELLSQFKSISPQYLRHKYEEICKMVEDTNNFDLDLRASSILLIEKFRS